MIHMTLGERVFEIIRDRILTGEYKPGDRLLYAVISEELDVSLSPVKEALLLLAQDGLVTLIPRKGAYVSQVSMQDVQEYSWIRLALESLACRQICACGLPQDGAERLIGLNSRLQSVIALRDINQCMQFDNEFHMCLVELSENQRLLETYKKLPLANLSVVAGARDYVPSNGEAICRTHDKIIEALRQGDAALANALLEQNIISPLRDIVT